MIGTPYPFSTTVASDMISMYNFEVKNQTMKLETLYFAEERKDIRLYHIRRY